MNTRIGIRPVVMLVLLVACACSVSAAAITPPPGDGPVLVTVLVYLLDVDSIDSARQVFDLIKRYSAEYDFDWLMIAAQAYQESHFDQSKKSSAGALGIMQLLRTSDR